jgi:hypothetical protein
LKGCTLVLMRDIRISCLKVEENYEYDEDDCVR